MTSITITPETAKKRLRFSGDCIAAGEHVGVTVAGFADKTVSGKLRLRVMLGKRTIAKFPLVMADPEADPPIPGDQWTNPEGTTDAYCELNLNTVPAQKYLRCGMECWIVLDDVDVPQKYGACDLFIGPWCKERGEDTPYDLDEYPDIVAGMKEDIEGFRTTVREAKTAAEGAVAAASTASNAAKTSANAAATAQNSASRAETSAETARTDADEAREDANRAEEQVASSAESASSAQAAALSAAESADLASQKVIEVKDYVDEKTQTANPSTATLADVGKPADVYRTREFVNSSVSTNTANYISDNGQPFSSYAALVAYTGDKTNNDYAFVVGTDSVGNTTYTRYKWSAATNSWAVEYVLNNSSFTASQWAAINSGITGAEWANALDEIAEKMNRSEIAGKLHLRALPKYLHELRFDDTYPADAAWLYGQLVPSDLGRCSAVRRGGKLWRNYDWTFDDAAEFVVKVSCSSSRFGSVGVASVGARLTENEVASGVYSRYYKCLPGMTLDGINENGVVCEINVDGGPKDGWHGAGANALHILAAVRWVLDHGETAKQAAEHIAANVIQPTGEMNFHFMVADATATYIVENGVAHDVTDGTKVLTNYALYDEAHAGGGKERYQLLAEGADISAVNFTNAYQSGNDWDSDFDSAAQHAAAITQWAEQGETKEAHRGKTTSSGKAWWQSVHTTEYDFAAKTMRVAVQEIDDWYVFAPGRTVDLSPLEAQITALASAVSGLESSKLDKASVVPASPSAAAGAAAEAKTARHLTERRVFKDGFTAWVKTDYDPEERDPVPQDAEIRWDEDAGKWGLFLNGYFQQYPVPGDPDASDPNATHLYFERSYGNYWFVADREPAIVPDGEKTLVDSEQLATKRSLTDNECHKTEMTPWVCNRVGVDVSKLHWGLVPPTTDYYAWLWDDFEDDLPGGYYTKEIRWDDQDRVDYFLGEGVAVAPVIFTRAATCTEGEKFMTPSRVFDSDGKPNDQFATDLLGKQVAIQKIDERLPIPISAKNAGFTTESYKRFIVTVGGNMTVTLHTPTAKQGGGYDAEVFECRFDGASLAADASIAFDGATATTMDTNCGTVTAGKVALMSAFWNGATWDVNWKVEG